MFKKIIGAAAMAALSISSAMAFEVIDLGGTAKGNPSVVWYDFKGADYVGAFTKGVDGHLYANVGDPVSTNWTGWVQIGDEVLKGSPSCVATTPQLIDCVATGKNNAIMHIRYNSKLHEWSDWESLGGFSSSDPSAVRTKVDGGTVLTVFVRGPDDVLFKNEFKDGEWTDWKSLDIQVGYVIGCTDVFVWGAHCYDTTLGDAKQLTDVTRQTGGKIFVDNLGGAITEKVSGVPSGSKGDTLRLFVHGPNDTLWINTWSNGAWSNWQDLGLTVSGAPACAMRKNGKMVICLSVDGDETTKAVVFQTSEL